MYLYRSAATVKCHFSEVLETLLEEDMAYVLKVAHSDLRHFVDRDHRMDVKSMTCVTWGPPSAVPGQASRQGRR
jgi:hypothetical protein